MGSLREFRELWDVSVPILETMHTAPDNVGMRLHRDRSRARGDPSNLSWVQLSLHAGAHVDAPMHMDERGAGAEQLPLQVMLGPAYLAEFPDAPSIGAAELERAVIPRGTRRLLLKTGNSARWTEPGPFLSGYVGLAPDGAEWVVRRGITLVGTDYLGIEMPGAAEPRTHLTLMDAGVVILEGLAQAEVPPGAYLLLCLPLRVVGGDGAPARVVLAR
jgi:arylformamidase